MEDACLTVLGLRRYHVIRTNAGLFRTPDGRWIRIGKTGDPDWVAIHARHPGFLLEVKRPGETPTPEQTTRAREIELIAGVTVMWVDSARGLTELLDRHEKAEAGFQDRFR